jgi:hypothetical protein
VSRGCGFETGGAEAVGELRDQGRACGGVDGDLAAPAAGAETGEFRAAGLAGLRHGDGRATVAHCTEGTEFTRWATNILCNRWRMQGREQRNRANDRVDRDAGNNTVHRVACAAALNRGPGQELPIHASYRVDSCVGKKSVKRIARTAVLNGEHGEDQRIRANDDVDSRAGKSSVQRTRVPPH